MVRLLAPVLVALGVTVVLAAAVARVGGADAGDAIRALVVGSVGSTANVAATLLRATPLLLTGAAVMLAFRSGSSTSVPRTVPGRRAGGDGGRHSTRAETGRWLLVLAAGAAAGRDGRRSRPASASAAR